MGFPFRLFLVIASIILLAWVAGADGNQTIDSNKSVNGSSVIFTFTKANPFEDTNSSLSNGNYSTSEKLESAEAHYNRMSEESDISPLHLNILGIPMECHFCLPLRVVNTNNH